MKDPLISVVIPVYNEEKYLDACLTSLLSQSYKKVELLLIDDGSSDNSLTIAKKYPLTILKQSHKGPGAARNKGIKTAKGEIIILADADMRYDKNYIKHLIDPIITGKAIGTFITEEYVANPENIWSRCWSINAGLPSDRRLPVDYSDTENAFRAILKKYAVAGYDEKEGYTDDSSLSKKIKKLAVNAPKAVSYHYNPSSLSEVFYSARWIGRSKLFPASIANFLRFSFINSLRVSIKYMRNGAPFSIVPFKLVFDAGVLWGIFLSGSATAK